MKVCACVFVRFSIASSAAILGLLVLFFVFMGFLLIIIIKTDVVVKLYYSHAIVSPSSGTIHMSLSSDAFVFQPFKESNTYELDDPT